MAGIILAIGALILIAAIITLIFVFRWWFLLFVTVKTIGKAVKLGDTALKIKVSTSKSHSDHEKE